VILPVFSPLLCRPDHRFLLPAYIFLCCFLSSFGRLVFLVEVFLRDIGPELFCSPYGRLLLFFPLLPSLCFFPSPSHVIQVFIIAGHNTESGLIWNQASAGIRISNVERLCIKDRKILIREGEDLGRLFVRRRGSLI
jgi:hypothetical protein